MIITVLAPEVLLGKYYGDLELARIEMKAMKKFAEEDGVPWTITHALLANMGGFAIRTHESKLVQRTSQLGTKANAASPTAASLKGNLIQAASTKNISMVRNKSIYHITGQDILSLRDSGQLPRLPYISLEEIDDRSKSDSLIRIITIIQISWTVVQVIVRRVRHLAISQLEIGIIAFAICAILIYGLNWFKPKDMQTPIVFIAYQDEIPPKLVEVLSLRSERQAQSIPALIAVEVFGRESSLAGSHLSNLESNYSASDLKESFALLGASVVFGGIHIFAWSFKFPSRVEQILWWTSSLWCTCGIVLWIPILFILDRCEDLITTKLRIVLGNAVTATYIVIYILARLYLLVEIFRTLWFLPPSAYYSTWATDIPHVA